MAEMNCIDRAVRNSPPPLDDVGGININDLDEKDPARADFIARYCEHMVLTKGEYAQDRREWMIDEAVRRVSNAFSVNVDKLVDLFPAALIRGEVTKNFRMIEDQLNDPLG